MKINRGGDSSALCASKLKRKEFIRMIFRDN